MRPGRGNQTHRTSTKNRPVRLAGVADSTITRYALGIVT
jgi:hypothetical protein